MTLSRKQRIEKSFGTRAHGYHQHAFLQQGIAKKLASFLPEKAPLKILEIGCGTGFLTEELHHKYPQSHILATDISAGMTQYAQQRFTGYKNLNFAIQDGEDLTLTDKYDMIISSMTAQWFNEPNQTLESYKKLLSSNGNIYFSTLGNKSFKEWEECLRELNLSNGILNKNNYNGIFNEEKTLLHYKNGLEFLRDFKKIGAHQPRDNYTILKQSNLKKTGSLLEKKYDSSVTWHIQYGQLNNDFEG